MPNFKLLMEKYLLEECHNSAESTKKVKKAIINKFGQFINFKANIDINDIIRYLNSKDFLDLENSSKNVYKIHLKQFCNWIGITGVEELLKKSKVIQKVLKKSDLLSKKEIREILKRMNRPIDKAIFIILLETKCRKSEILNLKLNDITFYDSYAVIYIRKSKSAQRNIPIIEAIPYINRYLEDHPFRDDPNAYLFIHKWNGRYIKYSNDSFNRLLKRNTEFLNKRVYPHLLRHTGLTEMAKHLTEFQLKQLAGWTFDSRQASRYVHLSNDDLENKILELHNIKPPKKEERINNIEIIKCPRCGYQNSDLDRFCSRCGSALSIQVVLEQREAVNVIENEYSVREIEETLRNMQQKLNNIKNKLE